MEQNHKYKGLSEKDAQHQKEWDDWFAKCFNEKGEYIEERDEAAANILKNIEKRKVAKSNVSTRISTTEEQKSFG